MPDFENTVADQRKENDKADPEFDRLADSYYEDHRGNIKITGEDPEYFSEYKILDTARMIERRGARVEAITDFGSGIGNSVPYFRKYFPNASLTCADVSVRSMELSRKRFPGDEEYAHIQDGRLPLDSGSQDLVFTACVFHHIPHEEHMAWLAELRRVTRPGGALVLFEHNPLNPLTVRAVNTCPLDENAVLIRAGEMKRRVVAAGWRSPAVEYKVFFPALFAKLRPAEHLLRRCALGAQYRLVAYVD